MSVADISAVTIALVAVLWDVTTSRIPNTLTFTTASLAIAFHVLAPNGAGFTHAVLGLLVGLLVFFPVFALGAMGAGDVKLMATVGAWLGAKSIISVALYGSIAGGLLALIVAVRRNYLKQALANIKMLLTYWWVEGVKPLPALTIESTDSLRMPYALAIAAGLVVTLWQH